MKGFYVVVMIASFYHTGQAQASSDSLNLELTPIIVYIDSFRLRLDSLERGYLALLQTDKQVNEMLQFYAASNNDIVRKVEHLGQSMEQLAISLTEVKGLIHQLEQETRSEVVETRTISELKIEEVRRLVDNRMFIGLVSILLLGIAGLLTWRLLMKKMEHKEVSIIERMHQLRREIENESVRLDEKMIQMLDNQLKLLSELPEFQSMGYEEQLPDHSLALKIADEVVRIEKNLDRMDESVKGYKQLKRAVSRIKDNLSANGYEIVEMLGKSFHEGMKVVATFIIDENLAYGEQIITRIIKPQVNFRGTMIQAGQVEVSQGVK